MEIIPVLDVRHGVAVRAVAGDRANYRPLETKLAPDTCEPLAIARGYRSVFPFRRLYIADLDGIEGRGENLGLAERFLANFPGVEFWIDNGTGDLDKRGDLLEFAGARPVLGSETGLTATGLSTSAMSLHNQSILSLDFRGDDFVGDPALLTAPERWPRDVIVMTLGRVGGGGGPDVDRVCSIVGSAGSQRRVYAAGGVRNIADLKELSSAGAAGALVATALHSGQIKTGDLEEIAGW